MKRLFCIILALLMISSMMVFADEEIKVCIDGNYVVFDQPPVIENGRTLVPLRAIFEGLNAQVFWDDETSTVSALKDTVEKETIIVKLQIGSDVMDVTYIDETKNVTLDVPAKIIGGRTMVPVRAISEALNCDVEWIGINKTVVVTPFEICNTIEKCHFLSGVVSFITEYDDQGRMVKEVIYEETGDLSQIKKYFYGDGEIRVDCYDYLNYPEIDKYYQIFDEEYNFIESGHIN